MPLWTDPGVRVRASRLFKFMSTSCVVSFPIYLLSHAPFSEPVQLFIRIRNLFCLSPCPNGRLRVASPQNKQYFFRFYGTFDPGRTWNTMPKWTWNVLSSIPSSAVSFVLSTSWVTSHVHTNGAHFVFFDAELRHSVYALHTHTYTQMLVTFSFDFCLVIFALIISGECMKSFFYLFRARACVSVRLLFCQKYLNNWVSFRSIIVFAG